MKIVISLLMCLFLQSGMTPDPNVENNQYLLVFTKYVPTNNNNGFMLTGQSFTYATPGATPSSSQYKIEYRYEPGMQMFTSAEALKEFVKDHTVHYYSGGSQTIPWDFTITDISGVYKLTPVEFSKVKVGTHTEYLQETKEVDAPSYEWRIK